MAQKLCYLFTCLIIIFKECSASTHWIVTEDGRIQAQMDTIFSLKRPYDLVTLMQQEKDAVEYEELKQKLMIQKEEIDKREDKETNLEAKMYSTDEDCIAAEKPLIELDLYTSTANAVSKEFDEEIAKEKNSFLPESDIELQKPNCSDIINLDFSMHAYEHLTGVRDRNNLTMAREESLHSAVTSIENIEVYGHLINEALQKNKTSWILFTMASYYWRVQGNATNAIECVRRALHFAPREHKDVPLISLGNILNHARLSEEAAIAVHAAVDIAPDNAICHFTLGNVYAVLADYNKSIICYENTLKVQPDFKIAQQRYHAVVCHNKIEKGLEAQHISLQRTLSELRDYQKNHEKWMKLHEKIVSEQASPEVKLEQRLEYEEQKIRESLDGRGQDCFQFEQNGHMVLSCNMRREAYQSGSQAQVDLSLNLQLLQAVESRAGRIGQKMAAKAIDQCQRT